MPNGQLERLHVVKDDYMQSLSSINVRLDFSNISELTAEDVSNLIEERELLLSKLDRMKSSIDFYREIAITDYTSVLKDLPQLPEHLREGYAFVSTKKVNKEITEHVTKNKSNAKYNKVRTTFTDQLMISAIMFLFVVLSALLAVKADYYNVLPVTKTIAMFEEKEYRPLINKLAEKDDTYVITTERN